MTWRSMSTTSARMSEIARDVRYFRAYSAATWRLVEAQHRISTNRLARNLDDQALLEQIIDELKPTLPLAARDLHYLLATPFRYRCLKSSRFRKAGERPGIFYASEHAATAVAETAYRRLLYFSRSPGFIPPNSVVEHSVLTVPIKAERLLNLTKPPFEAYCARWHDPDDYSSCQTFAGLARNLAAQAIRYESARDPACQANIAVLDPAAFAARAPRIEQTWHFRYGDGQLSAFAAFPSAEHSSFTFGQFRLTAPV